MSQHSRTLTGQALILGILAVGLGRLAVSDALLAFVRSGMRIPLMTSVALLAVLALSRANAADGDVEKVDDDDSTGRAHHHTPRIGWLLLVPVVCIAVIPIQPLGSDAVGDRTNNDVARSRSDSDLAVEVPSGGELKVLDYVSRVVNDPRRPFTEPVSLTGFVLSDPSFPDGFTMGRFVLSCCAADATPVLVRVITAEPPPPSDSWVEVTGMQDASTSSLPASDRARTENVRLQATEIVRIDEPAAPYESI